MGVQVLDMVYQCWLWRRRPKPCWFARITSVQCNFKQSNARSKEKRSKSITHQKKQRKMLWEQKCMEAGRGRGGPDDPSRVLEEKSWTCLCGGVPFFHASWRPRFIPGASCTGKEAREGRFMTLGKRVTQHGHGYKACVRTNTRFINAANTSSRLYEVPVAHLCSQVPNEKWICL